MDPRDGGSGLHNAGLLSCCSGPAEATMDFCKPCVPCCNERVVIRVQGDQPVVPVPVYQDVLRRDKYYEVPEIDVHDTLIPKVYTQETIQDVPKIDIAYTQESIEVETSKYVEKPVTVPVSMGYSPKFVPTWDVRHVPKPVPKYEGEQQLIEVEVPRVKYVDKYVDKEIVVDIKEKIVPKITEVEKPVEVVKYQWKEQYQDVPVYKYVPKFDVELACPSPLIVPYPEQKFVKDEPIVKTDTDAWSKFRSHTGANSAEAMPVFPMPTPQLDSLAQLDGTAASKPKKEESSWFLWPFFKEKPYSDEGYDASGYPKNMPKDFKTFFNAEYERHSKEKENQSENAQKLKELEPTVEYKGSVKKEAVFGGSLDPISFKLHAVEVHQFITLPNFETPKFVKLVPDSNTTNNKAEFEQIFGPVPDGWADPGITGMPAPMMTDILNGTYSKKNISQEKVGVQALDKLFSTERNASETNKIVSAVTGQQVPQMV